MQIQINSVDYRGSLVNGTVRNTRNTYPVKKPITEYDVMLPFP